jgi:hypothetical protein
MSVYVDSQRNPFQRMIMCHMVADTPEELHEMARAIGMRRDWFQDKGSMPHYDVSLSRRKLAVERGAIEISDEKLIELVRAHREKLRAS